MFFTNGAMAGNLLPRLPEAKDAFAMSDAFFGFAVIAMPVGAMSAAHFPAWFLRRCGDRRAAAFGSGVVTALLTLAGYMMTLGTSWSTWVFIGAVTALGFTDAVIDTAQNAQGLAVQRALGKPILMTMHAGWSIGGATGAAVGAFAARHSINPAAHFAAAGVVLTGVALWASRSFLPSASGDEDGPDKASMSKAVCLLVIPILIALAGFAVEEIGNSWAALFLRTERDFDLGTAGLGGSVLLGAQFVGRLSGDHVLGRFGRPVTVKASMALIFAGLILLTASAPAPFLAFIGLGMAGLGSAVTVPVAFAIADDMPALPPHSGLAIVGWLMRISAVVASPLTGLISGAAGLTTGMLVFVAVALAGMIAALRVRNA